MIGKETLWTEKEGCNPYTHNVYKIRELIQTVREAGHVTKLWNLLTGWAHLKLLETANEGRLAAYPDSDQIGQAKGGVGAAIDRLEGKLNK